MLADQVLGIGLPLRVCTKVGMRYCGRSGEKKTADLIVDRGNLQQGDHAVSVFKGCPCVGEKIRLGRGDPLL